LSLLLLVGWGCGDHRSAGFCGLARTVDGYDYVAASDLACAEALQLVPRFERGLRGAWACSRSVGGGIELVCLSRTARIELLERSPVPARRKGSAAATPPAGDGPIRLEEDGESSAATMSGDAPTPRFGAMKKRLYFLLIVTGLILLALGGWTVQGIRRFGTAVALRPSFG